MPLAERPVKVVGLNTLVLAGFDFAKSLQEAAAFPQSKILRFRQDLRIVVLFYDRVIVVNCLNNGSNIIKPWALAHGFIIFEPLFKTNICFCLLTACHTLSTLRCQYTLSTVLGSPAAPDHTCSNGPSTFKILASLWTSFWASQPVHISSARSSKASLSPQT